MSIESVMLSNHLLLCHPLLLLPSIIPSGRVFSNEWALRIRWPKYWSFRFSISLSKEYSGLISFRIDWFDFLASQETRKSLCQHCSLKASILWHSGVFMVQLWSLVKGLPASLVVKNLPSNAVDMGSIPGLGRSAGAGKGYPLQYPGLENIVHGVARVEHN